MPVIARLSQEQRLMYKRICLSGLAIVALMMIAACAGSIEGAERKGAQARANMIASRK